MIELEPEEARVAQHDEQSVSLTPREAELGEVCLCLVARIGIEANDLFNWCFGSHLSHEDLKLGQAPCISRQSALLEEPHGR